MQFILFFVLLASPSLSVLLNEVATIMSHDAATGYLVREHVVADWTITQTGTLYDQLNCGARSFDYRPYYEDGNVIAHHGDVKVSVSMDEALNDVLRWCKDSPANANELVILYVNSCEGDDGCSEAVKEIVDQHGLYSITDCSVMKDFTYENALSKSALINEYGEVYGHVAVIFGCVIEKYDETINCYGNGFVCYGDNADIPWSHYIDYVLHTSSAPPQYSDDDKVTTSETEGYLWMIQAHWQSTVTSIVDGTLHRGSVLIDEEKSGMNSWVAAQLSNTTLFSYVNIVELDNVCDHGLEVYSAVQKYNEEYAHRALVR